MSRSKAELAPSPAKVTLRKSSLWAIVAFFCAMSVWAGAATWYILKRDDFAARMIDRDTSRQYAYEDRIAGLRQTIDQLAGRQLVDQDSIEARLNELVTRQSQLETRHAIMTALADQMNTAPGGAVAKTAAARPAVPPVDPVVSGFMPLTSNKPMPATETFGLKRGPGEQAADQSNGWNASQLKTQGNKDRPASELLGAVDRSVNGIDVAQVRTLTQVDLALTREHNRLRSVIIDTGLNPDQLVAANAAPRSATSGQGGPFVPVKVDPKAGAFEAALYRLQPKLAMADRMKSVVGTLPLQRPIGSGAEQSSPFGYRSDPFTRSPAMHTGLDFRAEHGTIVRAAAPGKVVTSAHTGGYGNMVEIDHGNGLSTRYAHLSTLLVDEGETIAAGTSIGRVGSTGRSTGPHLHYEIRISDDAVDPQRFLRAGQKLTAANHN
jgi:murein DD-endopeptidase MepM/ murein hydrolase activator NlpD